jgi:hypothetical protein
VGRVNCHTALHMHDRLPRAPGSVLAEACALDSASMLVPATGETWQGKVQGIA